MANAWFQFKQFKIIQDKCGMKVSTDACIQGALAAHYLNEHSGLKSVLDIGTGTGILSLMLAQKHPHLVIDAIEIDEAACGQAIENAANTKWADRIRTIHTSLQNWINENISTCLAYDFIICNPPFFQGHLQAVDTRRNYARHDIALNIETLLAAVGSLLKEQGTFCLLYPQTGWDDIVAAALNQGIFLEECIKIHPRPGSGNNRVVGFFSKQCALQYKKKRFVIYQQEREYTPDFIALLKDYYLYL